MALWVPRYYTKYNFAALIALRNVFYDCQIVCHTHTLLNRTIILIEPTCHFLQIKRLSMILSNTNCTLSLHSTIAHQFLPCKKKRTELQKIKYIRNQDHTLFSFIASPLVLKIEHSLQKKLSLGNHLELCVEQLRYNQLKNTLWFYGKKSNEALLLKLNIVPWQNFIESANSRGISQVHKSGVGNFNNYPHL